MRERGRERDVCVRDRQTDRQTEKEHPVFFFKLVQTV